ncbi:uncharacterized protein [Nicotiana tomentosiformis]|uniref:uncharacterized protein n=1 Tax=Nicotiana tomentosiformis TaxID=4098 RepID=UPI00388C7C1D
MAKEIRRLTLASIQSEPHVACDNCGRGHPTHECQASTEEVNVVGNYNFNAMGQKYPGFSWSSPGQRQQFQPQQPIQPGLEDLIKAFIVKTNERLDAHGAAIKELVTGFLNLKRQVGYIATILSKRVPGTLPADTERNPKETPKNEVDKKKKDKKEGDKNKEEETSRRDESNESEHMHALPFPQKLYREKLDKQFERFLDMLKEVNVKLSFTEVLSQMLAYSKLLKDIIIKKRKIEETSVVKLIEHCIEIMQIKLPQKCGDPESFTIHCSVGFINFDKSLCDSGASINLIPLSIYRKLEKEIGEIRSVPISLQLADQTILIPEGIVEDVLFRVDKFVFPVHFIVVNMEENKEVPLILGRPFLAMGIEIIDIHERRLMLRVGEDTVTFEMNVETRAKKVKPTASIE